MADLAPLGTFFNANLSTARLPKARHLVPNSFTVNEAHDYMEWSVQVTIPINWSVRPA